MRVAVITDIHANLPALEAVLEATEAAGVEEAWCLGDVVGYGVEPDACVELVRERCQLCLVGNHDIAVLGGLDIASFSEAAAAAVEWTRDIATERTLEFLRELEPQGERGGFGLFHASPRDPVWEYVLSSDQAEAAMDSHPQRVGLIGHSHVALFFNRPARTQGARRAAPRPATARCSTSARAPGWSIPAASANPATAIRAAAWLELDTEADTARFHRVAYDDRAGRGADRRRRASEPPREPSLHRPVTLIAGKIRTTRRSLDSQRCVDRPHSRWPLRWESPAPPRLPPAVGEDAKLLPGSTAQEITENLDTVKQLADEGECVGAADAAAEVSTQVESLEGVDPKLKQALQRGVARLDEVVDHLRRNDDRSGRARQPKRRRPRRTEAARPGKEGRKGTRKGRKGRRKGRGGAARHADDANRNDARSEPPTQHPAAPAKTAARAPRAASARAPRRNPEANDGHRAPSPAATRSATGSARAACRASTRRPT